MSDRQNRHSEPERPLCPRAPVISWWRTGQLGLASCGLKRQWGRLRPCKELPEIRPVHLRMARAALNWTLREFEAKTGVNKNTISRYEAGGAILSDTLERIEKVFRAEGVVFIDEDEQLGPGVRLPREAKSSAMRGSQGRNEKTKPKSSRK